MSEVSPQVVSELNISLNSERFTFPESDGEYDDESG